MPSISLAVSSPGSSARSTTQTRAPSSAKRFAVSRPMPLAPPVMTATFPSRRPGMSALLRGDVDVLYLGVVVEGVRTELASDAGLLHPAEGCGDTDRGVGVYGDDTRLHTPGYAHGAGAVLRPDRAREAVDRVVRLAYRILLIIEGDHRYDGAEDLLPRRPVLVGERRENCRRIPEATPLRGGAPYRHGGVLGDVGRDGLFVLGGDERAHVGRLVEWVADAEALDRRLHEGEEVVEDAPLDEDARAGATVLPGVAEDGGWSFAGGLLEVGVGEDHVRRLAAELEGYALYGACGALGDPPPHLGRSGEGDLRDVRTLDQALPDFAPRPDDDVHDAPRDSGLPGYALERDGGQGREPGGLEDEGVPRGQRRGHLPARDREREVPRHDEPYDAQRLTEGDVNTARDGDALAEQSLRHPGVVVEGLGDHLHLSARVAYGLACVLRLQPRQVLPLGVEGVGEAAQQTRTICGLDVPPLREGLLRAGDRGVGVLLSRRFELLYYLLGGGVQNFEHLGDLRN